MPWAFTWLSVNLFAKNIFDSPPGLFGMNKQPLKSASITLAHLRQRCCEVASWPVLWRDAKRVDSLPMSQRAKHWIDAYSSVTSIVLDILLGIVAGAVLWVWADEMSESVRWLWRGLQTEVLRSEIEWFTEFPMGFKLNVPLTARLGSFVLFVADTFSDVIWQFPKFEHFLVRAIACSGMCPLFFVWLKLLYV